MFRFATYDVKLSSAAGGYVERMLATPALRQLAREAAGEGHALPMYDDLVSLICMRAALIRGICRAEAP